MNSVKNSRQWSFDRIAEALKCRKVPYFDESIENKRASVAMILHQMDGNLEILFIHRADHDLDPWSGHIAFPGGKLEEGEFAYQAACRETLEETGIDLRQARYLGRLSDIIGANLPVRVSCCLFGVNRMSCHPVLNDEVRDLFWVKLSDLHDPERHLRGGVIFDEKRLEVPAIRLPVDNKPLLWGITYRLVMQFLSFMERDGIIDRIYCSLPELLENS